MEKSCGKKPTNVSQEYDDMSDTDAIHLICKTFENHQSINEIRRNFTESAPPTQSKTQAFVSSEHVKKLLKNIDQKKPAGIDKIPPNLLQLSADILSTPLSNAINNSILKGKFPDDAKVASVSPLDKHTDKEYSVCNFRPVSVLNISSEMYGKVLKNMLVEKMNDLFSPLVAAYRENYNTQNVLIRLLEEWRLYLDNNYFVGAVMVDLSKMFDCIPHDLLIAKLEAYRFDNNTIRYVYSYLKNRKQCVKINNTYSDLLDIISVILIASAHNYADDNTLTSFGKTLEDLIENLEHEF